MAEDEARLFNDAAGLRVDNDRASNIRCQLLERVRLMAKMYARVPTFRVRLSMTGMTAAMIGPSFSVVILLDFPFPGDVSISSERRAGLHEQIEVGQ